MHSRLLIVAEHDQRSLKAASASTLSAALKIGGDIDVLIAGHPCAAAAAMAAQLAGIRRVILVDAPHYADLGAENIAALVAELAPQYSHVLTPASSFGKNFLPRAAALLGMAQVSDITAVEAADTFVRPIYAGNALATVRSTDPITFISVRASAFPPAASHANAAPIDTHPAGPDLALSRVLQRALTHSTRPELTSAKVVVSGGRGLGSQENYQRVLEPLADALGAALGASRAAVDANIAPNDFQVGQTGKIVAPELYFAIGLSGAIQHLAGMKESRCIVAINKDPDAPIFQHADYGLVADLFEAVPALSAALTSH